MREELQQQYRKFMIDIGVRRYRAACWLAIVFVPSFFFCDYFIYPEHFKEFLLIRFVASLCYLVVLLPLSYVKMFLRSHSVLGILLSLAVAAPIIVMTRFVGGYLSPYYAGLNLVILAVGILMPWTLAETIISCLGIYGAYLLIVFLFDDIKDMGVFINNNFFLSTTCIFAGVGNYFNSRLRLQEFKSRYELDAAYQKLRELDKAKMEFFANVSHELRTPLTLILAPMESLIKGKASITQSVQHGYLDIMYYNALRLLKLINNLLDLAKLDAGKMELYFAEVDMDQFLRGIVASVEPMVQRKGLGISCSLPRDLPEANLDRDKMEKVILNLVFNSIKFTEPGGKILIRCEVEDQKFKFCIEDTGIGISAEYLPNIFERFSQADPSATRKYEGTGIGMALAKEFVELHQGTIWVESEIGRGTRVFFTLPKVIQVAQGEAKQDKRTQFSDVQRKKRDVDWTRELHQLALYHGEERVDESLIEIPKQNLPKANTLLLVEDNADMLNFLIFQLQDEFNLYKARNGVEGIDEAKKNRPDLIISDVMMPIKDGYQLCREVKADPHTRHIPIILLTAKADLSMKIEGLEHGADEYLTKPFSSEELRARIKSLLSSRDMERQIQMRNEDLEKTLKALKEAQMQLVQTAKMASIGQLAAGIAHEMNNPLTAVNSSLFTLERLIQRIHCGETNPEKLFTDIEPIVERITTGVKRTKAIIDDLMNFARKDVSGLKEEDVNKGIASILTLLENKIFGKVKVDLELGKIPKVECSMGQINQVVMNLLVNALDAVAGKSDGVIRIKTIAQGDEVQIQIWDNGVGIPKEVQGRIFDPFFTTKDVGKGIGLGLSISHRIVDNHHGAIEFLSGNTDGTQFMVRLPVRQPALQEVFH